MSLRSLVLSAAALCLSFSSVAAHADTLNFNVATGGLFSSNSFSLDTSTLPSSFTANSIIYNNVQVTHNGVTTSDTVGFAYFDGLSEAAVGSGILSFGDGLIQSSTDFISADFFSNQSLFTGSTATPTFNLGTFLGTASHLTISDASPATAVTPEPSSILLLATGMMGIAFLYRRKSFASGNTAA
jgi:hypothetical protein